MDTPKGVAIKTKADADQTFQLRFVDDKKHKREIEEYRCRTAGEVGEVTVSQRIRRIPESACFIRLLPRAHPIPSGNTSVDKEASNLQQRKESV